MGLWGEKSTIITRRVSEEEPLTRFCLAYASGYYLAENMDIREFVILRGRPRRQVSFHRHSGKAETERGRIRPRLTAVRWFTFRSARAAAIRRPRPSKTLVPRVFLAWANIGLPLRGEDPRSSAFCIKRFNVLTAKQFGKVIAIFRVASGIRTYVN